MDRASTRAVIPAIVAVDDDDTVLGFASLSPFKPRAGVRADRRGLACTCTATAGAGASASCCSARSCALGADHGFHSVMARIVGGHDASIALHRKCGFEEIGCEREVGRKFGRWLDVVLMQRMLQ